MFQLNLRDLCLSLFVQSEIRAERRTVHARNEKFRREERAIRKSPVKDCRGMPLNECVLWIDKLELHRMTEVFMTMPPPCRPRILVVGNSNLVHC